MAKIKISYDTETSEIEVFIGKKKAEGIYCAFLHKDIENDYKFTLNLFSEGSGLLKVRNGKIEEEQSSFMLLKKIYKSL